MDQDKQIEKMKGVVCNVINFDICNKFDRCDDCPTVGIINALYNAGYRKQSELTPCDVCKFNPPSSGDRKPCTVCLAQAKMGKEDEGK